MQDAGWRPQSQEGKEEVEILLNDRRSFESVSGRASARGDNEDQPEKGIEDEYENESESESENGESDQGPQRGLSRSTKGTIWVVLMTMSTLLGRRLLRGSFPYPFFLVLRIQLVAWIMVAFFVIVRHLKNFNLRAAKATNLKDMAAGYSMFATTFFIARILLASSVAGLAALCGAFALQNCPNLPILVMLPITTYVFDSFFFRLAYLFCLLPRDQSASLKRAYKVIFVLAFSIPPIAFDYRLNQRSTVFAFVGFALSSLSKVIFKIGPQFESKGTGTSFRVDTPLHYYLLQGIAPIIISWVAATKHENYVAAHYAFTSWGLEYKLLNLAPGVLMHLLFIASMNSAHPFISEVHVGGALEEPTEKATDAIASTLQAGLWIIIVGVFGQEKNFVDWTQVIPFTLIYIVCVGPKHIAYYPPRLMNFFTRLFRRRQMPLRPEPWQLIVFIITTTVVFGIIISCNMIFWVDTLAYSRDTKTWLGPTTPTLDTVYGSPRFRSIDVVIAHSEGDSIASLSYLIAMFTSHNFIKFYNPRVIVYSKDSSIEMTEEAAKKIKGEFQGDFSIQILDNTGGVTATFLHHILSSWSTMTVQTVFLSTATPTISNSTVQLYRNRLADYFVIMGFPLPDAVPKTGFLNLGESESCYCGQCTDSHGWEDSFHLVPPMFSAARPGTTACESVLLTYGNNFAASAARIRATKQDVWQMLYDGLVDKNLENAWAHKREKMPVMLPGEEGKGRWKKGAVYGSPDSLAKPYLGLTIERLWGVLLQCSSAEIAWGCPALEVGWRINGRKEDCGCIE
ncbi:uncharacterized protein RAG0_04251 [Rhynchosporium agropyri]|uniref:Uncharacterized protein n=1 Tax=Rhynchosporium agropyri TaxID=914238 RepID=A0A1E1K7Z1_9HELO|nr:uncharacterized protein RAG0_04251 [Rhynchosporium agropyri]